MTDDERVNAIRQECRLYCRKMKMMSHLKELERLAIQSYWGMNNRKRHNWDLSQVIKQKL